MQIPCPACGEPCEVKQYQTARWSFSCEHCIQRARALKGLTQTGEDCPECDLPTLRRSAHRATCFRCGYSERLVDGKWEPTLPPRV